MKGAVSNLDCCHWDLIMTIMYCKVKFTLKLLLICPLWSWRALNVINWRSNCRISIVYIKADVCILQLLQNIPQTSIGIPQLQFYSDDARLVRSISCRVVLQFWIMYGKSEILMKLQVSQTNVSYCNLADKNLDQVVNNTGHFSHDRVRNNS